MKTNSKLEINDVTRDRKPHSLQSTAVFKNGSAKTPE